MDAEVAAGIVVLCTAVVELVGATPALLLVVALVFELEDVVLGLGNELDVLVVDGIDVDVDVDVEVEDVPASGSRLSTVRVFPLYISCIVVSLETAI